MQLQLLRGNCIHRLKFRFICFQIFSNDHATDAIQRTTTAVTIVRGNLFYVQQKIDLTLYFEGSKKTKSS